VAYERLVRLSWSRRLKPVLCERKKSDKYTRMTVVTE
jgi:hypothetical protein